MKNYTEEELLVFRINMAKWLFDLSICFSSEARILDDGSYSMAMPDGQLRIMVEMLVRLIIANKMTLEPEPYSSAIRMIASGETYITRLNVVSLMKAFKEEHQRFFNNKRPEKW